MVKSNVLGVPVAVLNVANAAEEVINLRSRSSYVCVSNVHMFMESVKDEAFMKVMLDASLVVPDGRPISIVQRLQGEKGACQVRGIDLMVEVMELCADKGIKIGFYGSTESVLKKVEAKLGAHFPKLNVGYIHSPPFGDLTEIRSDDDYKSINESGVEVLFVSLGCPKQEKWMAQASGKVNCVMVGIGAALDFYSGAKVEAPKILQVLCLEWMFRLFAEPRRLFGRYFINNPWFIYLIAKSLSRKCK